MSTSTSRSSYTDCFDTLDRALASPTGIRVPATTPGMAANLVTRLHYARQLSREEAKEIYSFDHPLYNISPYDPLIIRRPREIAGKWWVYIEPRQVVAGIEELKAAE
jgi:hypothetical protein